MDAASFGISIVSLALQVVNVASDGYSFLRQSNDPDNLSEDLMDLQVQQCIFMSWVKASGLSDERLPQSFDSFKQQTILNVLCSLLKLLNDVASHCETYGLLIEDPETLGLNLSQSGYPVDSSVPTEMMDMAPFITITTVEEAQTLIVSARASFSKIQQSRWKISNKNSFRSLIRLLKDKNEKLALLLPMPVRVSASELGETMLLQSEDVKYLKHLAKAHSSWISLAQSADFKSNLIESDGNKELINDANFIPRVRLAWDSSNEDSRTFATYENGGLFSGRVLVEWKQTGTLKRATSAEENERITLERIKELAVILARPTDGSFRSLACLGYTRSGSSRIGLVFRLPDSAHKVFPSVSLYRLLQEPGKIRSMASKKDDESKKPKKPALEDRLRLAHTLALSLYRLHRTGWIHKHINPMNIIFFPGKAAPIISIHEPFLTGFDFAREEIMVAQSEIPDSITEAEVPYRHPAYESGKSSTKAVDIYALGVLLIEVASWVPIQAAQEQAKKQSMTNFHAFLVSEFIDSGFLAYRMGTDYEIAVKHCLQVDLENEELDGPNILGSFYGNVVQSLASFIS